MAKQEMIDDLKAIFDGHSSGPAKGLRNAQRFVLGVVLVC